MSFRVREGEETTVHSFLFKSLFLLGSQVHWEARADAGRESLQRVYNTLEKVWSFAEIWTSIQESA